MKKNIVTKTVIKNTRDTYYGMRSSLRGSGKIRKRTILGEKFDYGEKLKEKKNYVLYVSGQGQEKKEIEEIEQLIPGKKSKEKIVEEKQIIDNYQYHESKSLKKKHRRNSTTHHERLSTPFERTTVKKYSSYTSEPRFAGYKTIKTTSIVDKTNFSRNLGYKNNYNSSSFTSNSRNLSRNNSNSKVYETYIPPRKNNNSKNNKFFKKLELNRNNITISNYSRRIPTSRYVKTTENSISKNTDNNKYRKKSNVISINYFGREKENYFPQQVVEYEYQDKRANKENVPINGQVSITLGSYKKEKKRVRNYIVKVNTINKTIETSAIPKSGKFGRLKPRFGSRPGNRCERRPFGGPRLNFPGSQRPRSGNTKKRILPLPRNTEIPKGYLPFTGQGFRVGGDIPKPKPMHRISGEYIPRPTENFKHYKEYSSHRIETIEKNISYNNSSHSNIINGNNNLRNIICLKNDYSKSNKSFAPIANYRNIEFNYPIFPGNGTRVGGSGLVKKIGLDSGSASGTSSTISYSEYRKYEQRANQPGNHYISSSNNYYDSEENLDYQREHENEGICKEVFCPVHGRQLIRYTEYYNNI